jgi:hypothetical protein
MKKIGILVALVLCLASAEAQLDAMNRAYAFSRINPAFVASPIDFNRTSAIAGPRSSALLMGQYYLANFYTGVGAYAENTVNGMYAAGLNAAVHTIFLNKFDLQVGAQLEGRRSQIRGTSIAANYGLLLYTSKRSLFFGFNMRQQFAVPKFARFAYSFQAGGNVFRFLRRGIVRAYSTADFENGRLTDLLIQPTLFVMKFSAGLGYNYRSDWRDRAIVRLGYKWKRFNATGCYGIYTSNLSASQKRNWEFSLQYILP